MAALPLGTGSGARKLLLPAIGVAMASTVALIVHKNLSFPPSNLPGVPATARVVVGTRGYDLGRTGWNQNEAVLSPATVTPQTFHKIAEIRVVDPGAPKGTNDKIEASPLYVSGVATPAGMRDLLVIATSQNNVMAFD